MQVQALDLDSCEVTPNRGVAAKFDSIVAAHEASAAEGLSQLLNTSKLELPSLPSPTGSIGSSSPITTADSALSPQKVRTERYVKVSVKGVSVARQKNLFLSWFLDNNGLPDCCLLLIPERHPNVIISFKGTHGWIELDTNHCRAPDYEIQFELKLHHAFLNRRRYVQNQPIVLRFFLLDKREDGSINNLGEVLLSVLLMSSKCANRNLIAHLVKDDKQRDLALSSSLPSMSLSERKTYEESQQSPLDEPACTPLHHQMQPMQPSALSQPLLQHSLHNPTYAHH